MDGQKTDGGYGTGDEIGHGSGNESGCGPENGKFVRTPCGKYIKYIPIPVVKKFNNNIKINNNKHYKQPK